MSHKLGICIPFRNREHHLKELIPHLSNHLTKQGIDHRFYVGHQVDDKLLNRGGMKNIAAHHAFQEGCDYVAWHDVDMLPHEECDYSYPEDVPTHIATQLSKYDYGLGYDQYFGGVILFNREQVERTNGYSNEYWDWGQEDDDLFWRCYYENYTTGRVIETFENKAVANFNGNDSVLLIPPNKTISSCLHNDHTISFLFNAEQQNEKHRIFLVGDEKKSYIEYPMLRKFGSGTWGLSFNNSRAVSMILLDRSGKIYYNWGKRFEGLWTRVTLTYNRSKGLVFFYINDELISYETNTKRNEPFFVGKRLMTHNDLGQFIIGYCFDGNQFYRGKIAEIKIYNRYFDNVQECVGNTTDVVLDYDFDNHRVEQFHDLIGQHRSVDITHEDVGVVENVLPYRREGRFICLSHKDEGYVNGQWVKGSTTAKNEKRLVTEMQQRKIDYKTEGINNILNVSRVESADTETYPNTTILNTVML